MKEYNKDVRNGQSFFRGPIMDWKDGHGRNLTPRAKAKNKSGHGHSLNNSNFSHLGKSKLQQIASLRAHMAKLDHDMQRAIRMGRTEKAAILRELLDNAIAKFVLVSRGLNCR